MLAGRPRVAGLIVGVLLASTPGQAQTAKSPVTKPPPPEVVLDLSKPHLAKNKLDYAFCRYPPPALRARVEGCCRMKVKVGADGRVLDIAGECTDPVFSSPSQACLQPQQYMSARKGKKTVTAVGEIVIYYSLASAPRTPSLWSAIGSLFNGGQPKTEDPEPDMCRKRPTDMISMLPTARG